MIAYPKTDLPNTIQFLPTGGPSGGPAFKMDGAGSEPTILAIKNPLPKLSDWSTSVEYLVDTSTMAAASNGYEGCGIRSRLLKQGTSAPYSIYDSGLLAGMSDDWHVKQGTWHAVSQRLDYGVTEQPEAEDIQFVVKVPLGNYVKLAQLSVVNQYSRFYETEVEGEADSLAMARVENQVREWLFRPLTGDTVARTVTHTNWVHYLDTLDTNIKAGENVKLTFSGVLNAMSDSDSDVPITLKASTKLTAASGGEIWKDVATIESSVAEITDSLLEDSIDFIAGEDYPQAELVITLSTQFGRVHATNMGHKGMHFTITTSRSIVSTNG